MDSRSAIPCRSPAVSTAQSGIQEYDTGVFVNVPWVNFGKYSAGVSEAQKDVEMAQQQVAAARTEALGLVQDQLKKIETAAGNYELFSTKIVPLARQTIETTRAGLRVRQNKFPRIDHGPAHLAGGGVLRSQPTHSPPGSHRGTARHHRLRSLCRGRTGTETSGRSNEREVKMKRKQIVILVLLALVALAGGAFISQTRDRRPQIPQRPSTPVACTRRSSKTNPATARFAG